MTIDLLSSVLSLEGERGLVTTHFIKKPAIKNHEYSLNVSLLFSFHLAWVNEGTIHDANDSAKCGVFVKMKTENCVKLTSWRRYKTKRNRLISWM